jgi:TetR/AcrR family transcriptional repressor of nem operon
MMAPMNTEHTDVRQHILDTAKPIILGKGFSAVGLNELLAEAGVPKGSFYHYFKSKELFGEALLDSYFSDYQARLLARLTQPGETAAQRLMSYWTTWLETQTSEGTEGKCLTVKLSGEVSDLSEAMRAALQNGTTRIIDCLADCISDGVADGSLPARLDARSTALTLYTLWLGATLLTKVRRDRSALEAALAATRALLSLPSAPAG